MFTGIIQQKAILKSRNISGGAGKLTVQLNTPLTNPVNGESIAVNGVCLTLENANGKLCTFHVLAETLKKTNLGLRPVGSELNIERALRMGDSLGGHIVSGHIDGTGKLISCKKVKDDVQFHLEIPKDIAVYMVPKGSIAIDGVSLTIVECSENEVLVCLIPTTLNETNLEQYRPGDAINVEADMLAKQVHLQLKRMFSGKSPTEEKPQLTMEDIFKAGF